MVDNILLKAYFVNIDLCLFKLNRKYHRYQVNLQQMIDVLKDENEDKNEDENMAERNIMQKIIDVSSDKMEFLEHLALAEAFPILYGDFQHRTSEIK